MDLFESIRKGANEEVLAAIAKDPANAAQRNADGASLLTVAAYFGNTALVAALRNALPGLDPYEAVIVGDLEAVRSAIGEGWEPNTRSPDGFTPLALAVFFRHPEIFDLLLPVTRNVNDQATNSQQVAALHAAVAVGDQKAVERLLRAGADPNLAQADGFLPLHVTAQHGDTISTALLVLFGAQTTRPNSQGKTPADFARTGGHDWLARLLEDRG
ncbi:hypothetical protein [Devosia sp. DBB001]|nr:hypothetical protein [Devosia sp. DBB001]